MASGPNTAPIIAQNCVFAPLLSAINQRRNAHDMHIIEMIIKPAIMPSLLYFRHNFYRYVKTISQGKKTGAAIVLMG